MVRCPTLSSAGRNLQLPKPAGGGSAAELRRSVEELTERMRGKDEELAQLGSEVVKLGVARDSN